MSEKTSSDRTNDSESDNDFRVSALLLRNDIKKRMHNNIEKRRKDKINSWIYKLADLLPFREPKRDSKVHILETMFHYVSELKDKCDRLMLVSTTALNDVHVKEIQKLTKRCKELEEKNKNYYKLLQTAGISANAWPQDIQFDRPTKYSKKITEQQLSEFLAKNSEKFNQNNKRTIESTDDESGQTPNKKSKSKKTKKKKEKENKERDLKNSPPTPVLPKPSEQLSPTTSSSSNTSSNSNTSSAPVIILNDQNLSSVQTVDEPRLIVNTQTNAFNGLNTFQIRQPFGSQPLQILGSTLDANLLSRQLMLNLNPQPPPPPQATAVLLPNGQLLPIITQPQPQQQPLLYATNQGILLTTPTSQSQTSLFSGQTANIVSNFKTNSINLNQTSTEMNPKPVPEEKPIGMTTTIEAVAVSEKVTKKVNKCVKKQLFVQKSKNSKRDKRKQVINERDGELNGESCDIKKVSTVCEPKSETKSKSEQSLNTSKDKIKSRSLNDKNLEKNEKSVKNTNNSKSKQVLTEVCGTTNSKEKDSSSCDILAEATQSIFSPPPNTCKQVSNSGKKVASVSNKNKAKHKSVDNEKDVRINDSIAKSTTNVENDNKRNNSENISERSVDKSEPKRVQVSNQNEVIGAQSVASAGRSTATGNTGNSGTTANKANTDVINDTNKNGNYVRNTTIEPKSKVEKSIAAGNKAEISKKSANNTNNADSVGPQHMSDNKTDSLNHSAPEPSAMESSDRQSNANHRSEQSFAQSVVNGSENRNSANNSDANTLEFGFTSDQNPNASLAHNEASNGETQTMMTENELPSLLLSLNDENDVSTESVHSVSNSSLPAFLSLSPEHLTEYLPKENISANTEADHSARNQNIQSNDNEMQFRINSNDTNVEQNSSVRTQGKVYPQMASKESQNYNHYPKTSEHSVAPTTQTESRSSYTSNFPAIPTLINNDYSDFVMGSNKSMFTPNNSANYLENLNPKSGSQSNNLFQFPLQNDNSFMPLYPMHSYPITNYLPNATNNQTNREANNSSANRTGFLSANENQSTPVNTVPKGSQNSGQNQTPQVTNQTSNALRPTQAPQQSKPSQTPQQNNPNQSLSQSNAVIAIRTQRNPSTDQLPPQPQSQQRHPTQSQHTSPVGSNGNSSNKSNANSNPVQYSNHTFSSYSAEALIRQNEPPIQQMANNDPNRYNANTGPSGRVPQQNHSSNIAFSNDRNASRSSISYSAESLIQSNQMPNKQRENETDSINNANNDNNRISYYQNTGHNPNSVNNNLVQRTDQNNNSNNLFNFDHSINSRLISSSSHNYANNYPQISLNSHLPDLRSSTVTTTAETLFPVPSSVATVNSSTNRNLSSNSSNSIPNGNNNANSGQMNHTMSTPSQPAAQQHSPVVYQPSATSNSNTHQNKRTTTNNFNSVVNPFLQPNEDNYQNGNHSVSYPSSGQPLLESNTNVNPNHYPRNSRNSELRFGNCLQTTNQNPNVSMASHNNPNTGCFFTNTPSNTTFFPSASTTPFPPLLPSAASPFDPTFGTTHRPPMFLPDFNPPFANSSAPNPLPPITGSNFNVSSSNNSSNNSNAIKTRETHPSNSRNASNLSRSPNQSKHSKINQNNTSTVKTKKQNNTKQTDSTNNGSSSRQTNDNYLSMNDLMTTPANQPNSRYPNFSSTNQTGHNPNRQPVPSPSASSSSHANNSKSVNSNADTSSSYSLFRPQSQNSSNASGAANFTVNSLQNPNRSATGTSAASHFGSTSGHHSSHATNFHLSNIFPDINANSAESLALSPMKFPPPVAPMVPPPVAPPLSQSVMEANAYPNHHSAPHHQNIYHSHHSSARISTPHTAFNSFLSSGSSTAHNSNSHSFDAHITPNARTGPTSQTNSSHPTTTFAPTHPHSHHTYPNILF